MRVRRDDVTARSLVDDIRAFEPLCAQERVDRELMLERLACDPDAFERTSPAHVTCSAWVVDEAGEQTVLCYHKIYDSWSWVGGHADGCRDLVAVAARELEEGDGVLLQVFPENAIVNGLFDKRFADAAVEAGGTYGSTADEVFLALDSVVTRERPEETLGKRLPWPRSRS